MPRSPTRGEDYPPDEPDKRSTEPIAIIQRVPVITRETRIVPVMPVSMGQPEAAAPEVPLPLRPRMPPEKQPELLTPVHEKELTPVKQKSPEKISGNLTNPPQNDNFSVNFSPAPTAKKLPKKMQFKGKKGRQRTESEVIDLLTFVQNRNGAWPNDNYVSDQMRRYYRREYPEYFRKARKKGSTGKVHAVRPAPIDLSTRRSGAGY